MEPHLPFKTRLQISIGTFAAKLCVRSDGTINRRLFSLLDQKVIAPTTKVFNDVPVSSSDISVDPSRNLWFRLFVPDTKSSAETLLPLIVYFHGGGFTYFGPDSRSFDALCCNLAAQIPATIVSVNYRLAPEHRFPCAYDDGFDTLKYIEAQNYAVLPSKTDLSKCFIAGDSAGGNIAHHVTHRACKDSHLNFLPEGADRNHKAANVFRDGPNFKAADTVPEDFPSSLVFVAGFDPLQDWQKRYCVGLRRCGKEVWLVEYPNGIHGFYNFPELPESALFVKEVRQFIQEK
ncbi:unnamed protein product [Coffea canephora]|uniref:Alpha/beta hydrolase fold-3 domain-containing protein n=1 Tax=Coffea canephora TaxID=49390 RepID=A0A068VHL0_COFCA|nr:unnamed protein product [Coffea canephora]